ncbi:MAG: glycosyltransferase, partial [Bacteroidetes bacterium]|nr:glycosyltransferase [Bacteroidota bacterium]
MEYKKNNFSKAIAISENRLSFKKSWQENAAYRLGLYITIANLAEKDYTWQGLFARSVSLATCGKHQEATEIAFEMLKWHSKRKDYYKLPVALAPFLPELALKLIEDREVPTSLRAALLQKNGRDRECYYLLSQAFNKGEYRLNPELYLYKSNAEVCDNRTRLEYFNAFLVSRGLSQVSLKNPEVSVSPVNLCSSANLPPISGSSLVTILMTSHQNGRYIGKAIASVLSQTWRNIELILIDDASCDDTLEVIADWCRK